jgi:hypothetical protein
MEQSLSLESNVRYKDIIKCQSDLMHLLLSARGEKE